MNNLAAAVQDISAGALQRLDRWLLVDAQDQRVCRRVQVEADNIGGLGRKLRVGADAPRAPPAQLDAFLAQQAPDRIVRGTQRGRQRSPIPTGQPLGRRQFQLAQNPQPQICAIFGGLARPSPIPQPGQPSCRKALAPQTHRIRPHAKLAANRVVPFALQAGQNNLGPFHQAGLLRPASSKRHQLTSLLGGAGQGYRDPCHRTPQLVCSTKASYLISYNNAIRH